VTDTYAVHTHDLTMLMDASADRRTAAVAWDISASSRGISMAAAEPWQEGH
jgi:hypothetical protein